jgi:PAS domain S-box-containing protein
LDQQIKLNQMITGFLNKHNINSSADEKSALSTDDGNSKFSVFKKHAVFSNNFLIITLFLGLFMGFFAYKSAKVLTQGYQKRLESRVVSFDASRIVESLRDIDVRINQNADFISRVMRGDLKLSLEDSVAVMQSLNETRWGNIYKFSWLTKLPNGTLSIEAIHSAANPGHNSDVFARPQHHPDPFVNKRQLLDVLEVEKAFQSASPDNPMGVVTSQLPLLGEGYDFGTMMLFKPVFKKAYDKDNSINSFQTTNTVLVGMLDLQSLLLDKLVLSDGIAHVAIRDVNSNQKLMDLNLDSMRKVQLNLKSEDTTLSKYTYDYAWSDKVLALDFTVRSKTIKNWFSYLPEILFLLVIGTFCGILWFVQISRHNAREQSTALQGVEQRAVELQAEANEREHLNRILKKSERENRAIIDAVSDIIFEIDEAGTLVFLNKSWPKITGFDVENGIDAELFSLLHPTEQEQQRADFQSLLKGHKTAYRTLTRIRTSDGTFRSVELALSMIRQDSNKSLRVVGTMTDIEERKRAEKALHQVEKKYRAIVENAAGGIYQLTPEGMYLSVNPAFARILGFASAEQVLREIKNANATVYIDATGRKAFIRALEERGVVHNHETLVMNKAGDTIWINENARAVRDDSGAVLYFEGSIEDITARKKAEMELHEAKVDSDLAHRAKSQFLANMSHELRTPLNSIIGFSEIIKKEIFGPVGKDEYRDYACDIHNSGNNLLQIINEILDVSKLEAGRRELQETQVDVTKLIDSALDLLSERVQENDMVISNNIEHPPKIVAEERAMKQVVLNLLSNAIKFTPKGGRVNISHHMDHDGRLHLSITDTGIGLDDLQIKKALSPFGQVDNELSRGGSGTGLGLTLVNELVKLHDGEFELLSQKGIGTTATIILPAARILKS